MWKIFVQGGFLPFGSCDTLQVQERELLTHCRRRFVNEEQKGVGEGQLYKWKPATFFTRNKREMGVTQQQKKIFYYNTACVCVAVFVVFGD